MLQVVKNWYPGKDKESKGVVLVVTAGKEGAISGGDKFLGVSGKQAPWGAAVLRCGAGWGAAAEQGGVRALQQTREWPMYTAPATRSTSAVLQPFLGVRLRLCHYVCFVLCRLWGMSCWTPL